MKKLLSILLLQILVFAAVFGAAINSKQGYKELAWGSTVDDAKKAGYKLTPMNKEYTNKLYSVEVNAYEVTSKDKSVTALQFHYYMGNLFLVSETLTSTELDPQKLSSRYGDFNKQGIYLAGKQYTDAKRENNTSVSSLSIFISANSKGYVTATMYDWTIYRVISYAGQKLAQGNQGSGQNAKSTAQKNSIVGELEDMANKLVQEKAGNAKPTYAILPLATDYKNTLVEDYVTEALTEALFNTGKSRIIERANLEAILKEQKFQSSGLVNEETAKSIGMIAGADFICYGTLKDLGSSFTVNARVIDVETGELCAISRATVTKDEYLKKQPQSAVAGAKTNDTGKTTVATTSSTNTAASTPAKTTSVANNAWKVKKYTDEFGGFTQYIFIINSTDEKMLLLNYKKCEQSANNRVTAGIFWGFANPHSYYNDSWYNNSGTYDIKGDSGSSVTKNLPETWKVFFDQSEKDFYYYAWDPKAGARWLVDIMRKNDSVAVRRDGLTRRFQTAGLLDKMAEYGITWAEIDAAMANEEF